MAAIEATLVFLQRRELWDSEKPYLCHFPVDNIPGAALTNIVQSHVCVNISDLRETSKQFQLDNAGFEWLPQFASSVSDDSLRSSQDARRGHCDQIERLLLKRTGGFRAMTFQTVIRRSDTTEIMTGQTHEDVVKPPPIRVLHVDFSHAGGIVQMNTTLKQSVDLGILSDQDAEELRSCHFQIYNTWKPLQVVHSWPLALCDYRTLSPSRDLSPVDQVYPDHVGESMSPFFHEDQRWYYVRDQQPTDLLMFRICDSRGYFVAPFTAHGAFQIPQEDGRMDTIRESTETRTLIFFK